MPRQLKWKPIGKKKKKGGELWCRKWQAINTFLIGSACRMHMPITVHICTYRIVAVQQGSNGTRHFYSFSFARAKPSEIPLMAFRDGNSSGFAVMVFLESILDPTIDTYDTILSQYSVCRS
jgi:hypothetical protein